MLINLYNIPRIANKIHRVYPIMKINVNNTLFNPLPGSTLGIPLNIIQYIFTTAHYDEVILTKELILIQFCLGFFTYGLDRLFDAYEYYNNGEREIINSNKKALYNYLINNDIYFITSILISYIYIFNELIKYDNGIIFILLLLSTLFYKNIKTEFGQIKAIYIGIFWSLSCIIMPCVIHDNNLSILNDPTSYLPCFFTLFASSNLLDIKDIEEDKNNNIYTLPVIFGERNSILISYISTFLSIIIFLYNPHFKDNIIPNLIFELQNIGIFIIPFSQNYKNYK